MRKPYLIILIAAIIVSVIQGNIAQGQAMDTNGKPPMTVLKPLQAIDKLKPIPTVTLQAISSPAALQTPTMGTNAAMQYIFQHESGNRLDAVNSIGACGLGQSLSCSKLSNVCPDWQTDAACQIKYFTSYANARYGGWVNAQIFWSSNRYW